MSIATRFIDYGIARTPEAAQRRHNDMGHDENQGRSKGATTWENCQAEACRMARYLIGLNVHDCPACGGKGYVIDGPVKPE